MSEAGHEVWNLPLSGSYNLVHSGLVMYDYGVKVVVMVFVRGRRWLLHCYVSYWAFLMLLGLLRFLLGFVNVIGLVRFITDYKVCIR